MPNLIDEFRDTLMKTKREGMAELLSYMTDCGFLEAPCSGSYHLAKEGGLLEHSLNVLHCAEKISVALIGSKNLSKEMKDSIAICALLHDLGKMGQFEKPNYVPNYVKSKKKNPETGDYDMVLSTAKPYQTNPGLLAVDHEIRSIVIASMFIDLTEEEQFAILYHNGMYGNLKYTLSGKETPLFMIIHWADMWATRIIEREKKTKGENADE